jgi:RsiW-degrading membrane proteinase PrsW (M82 family)
MTPLTKRFLLLAPLAFSLVWLCYDAPGPFAREAYFVVELLLLTIGTRTVAWGMALSGLSLGIGVAAPAVVFIGTGLSAIGLDPSDVDFTSWAIVPVLEEAIKLLPVAYLAWQYERRAKASFNPSDFLLIGCAVGAGFAMVENAQLVVHDPGVLRDMALQYGPSLLVPGAWGETGFVGHAAATGLIAAGYGVSVSLRRSGRAIGRLVLIAPFLYIVMEHMLANLRVTTGSDLALALGNGRLTPWLFLVMAGVAIVLDGRAAALVLTRSRILRMRFRIAKGTLLGRLPVRKPPQQRALLAAQELRLLNTVAWLTLDRRRS